MYKFGQKVKIDKYLRKTKIGGETSYREKSLGKKTGIIIGKRVVKEGYRFMEEYGWEFCAKNYIPVYLVSYDMRFNPVHVTAEQLNEVN